MSLILDEQFLSGFVTQSELEEYTGRLSCGTEVPHTPDGAAKGLAKPFRRKPVRPSLGCGGPQPGS